MIITALLPIILWIIGMARQDIELAQRALILSLSSQLLNMLLFLLMRPKKQHKSILKTFLACETLETYNSHIWEWATVHETLRKQSWRILNHHPVKGITGDIISAEDKREIARYIKKFKSQKDQELTNYYHLALSVDAIIQEYRTPKSKEDTL